MENRNKIIDYLTKEYGYKVQPCSIPKNAFEDYKIDFYLWIKHNISKKLFYFLRDKVFPIRYREEHLDNSKGLIHRDKNGKIDSEITIGPDICNKLYRGSDWEISTYIEGHKEYCFVDSSKYKEDIDDFVSKIPIFVPHLREKKIDIILKTHIL